MHRYLFDLSGGREYDARSTAPRPPIYVAHERGMADAFVAFRFVRLARQFVVSDFVDSFDTLFQRCLPAASSSSSGGASASGDNKNNNTKKKKNKGGPSSKTKAAAAKPRDTKRALLDALDARAKALRAQITDTYGNFSHMAADNILVRWLIGYSIFWLFGFV